MTTPGHGRTVGSAVAIVTAGQLPAFLTGALAVQIRQDLGFSVAGLGLAVGLFFVASAIGSAVLGRLVERLGWRAGMRIAVLASIVSLVGVAALASSWRTLAACLVVAGLGNALGQPAANLALARLVPASHHGVVFGIKQSAIPVAMVLGGLAVPLVALTVGWRWTYAIGAVAALIAGTTIPRRVGRSPSRRHAVARPSVRSRVIPSMRALVMVAAAGGLGAMVGNSLGAFLVSSAVESGVRPGTAGLLLAGGSAVGLVVRVVLGWTADRVAFSPTKVMTLLLAVGSIGCVLLRADALVVIAAGALLGFGAGWAWPGLLNLAIVRAHPDAPALATAIMQTGVHLGAAAGPMVFGAIVERWDYAAAWGLTAGIALLAACLTLVGGRALADGSGGRAART